MPKPSQHSCQGCGWNIVTLPGALIPREWYCAACDPKGEREANRREAEDLEAAMRSERPWDHGLSFADSTQY